jgi:hypothetical protein
LDLSESRRNRVARFNTATAAQRKGKTTEIVMAKQLNGNRNATSRTNRNGAQQLKHRRESATQRKGNLRPGENNATTTQQERKVMRQGP